MISLHLFGKGNTWQVANVKCTAHQLFCFPYILVQFYLVSMYVDPHPNQLCCDRVILSDGHFYCHRLIRIYQNTENMEQSKNYLS